MAEVAGFKVLFHELLLFEDLLQVEGGTFEDRGWCWVDGRRVATKLGAWVEETETWSVHGLDGDFDVLVTW